MDKDMNYDKIEAYKRKLWEEERSPGTIEKYLRDITSFAAWLDSRALDREIVIAWKEHLLAESYLPQLYAVCPQRLFPFHQSGGLSGEVPAGSAQNVPGSCQGSKQK